MTRGILLGGILAGLGGTMLGIHYLPSHPTDSSLSTSPSETGISASSSNATLDGGGVAGPASGPQELAEGVPLASFSSLPYRVRNPCGCCINFGEAKWQSSSCCEPFCPRIGKGSKDIPRPTDAGEVDYATTRIYSAEGSYVEVEDPYPGAHDQLNSGSMGEVVMQGPSEERKPLQHPDVAIQNGDDDVEDSGVFDALQIPFSLRAETTEAQVDIQVNAKIGIASDKFSKEIKASSPDENESVDICNLKRDVTLDLLQDPSCQNLSL